MSASQKRAKLQAGLLAAKGAPKSGDADTAPQEASDEAVPATAPAKKIKAEDIFYGKGDATAATFRPWYWSYDRQGEEGAPDGEAAPTAPPGDAKAQLQRLTEAAARLRSRLPAAPVPEPVPEPTGEIARAIAEAAPQPAPEPTAEIASAVAEAAPPAEVAPEPAPEPTAELAARAEAEIAPAAEAQAPEEVAPQPTPEPTAELVAPAEAEIAPAAEAQPPEEVAPEPTPEPTAELAAPAEAEIAPAVAAQPPEEVAPAMDIAPSVESGFVPVAETAPHPASPLADLSPPTDAPSVGVTPTPSVAEDDRPLADPEPPVEALDETPSAAVSRRPSEAQRERPHQRARRAMRAAQDEPTAPPARKTKRRAAPVAEPEPPAPPEPAAPTAAESAPSLDEIGSLSAAPQPDERTATPPVSEDEPAGDLAATIESAMNRRRYNDQVRGASVSRGGSIQNITGNSLLAELAAAREARGGEGTQRATEDSHLAATRTSRPLLDRLMTFGGIALILAVAVLALSPAAQYGPVARLTHLFN